MEVAIVTFTHEEEDKFLRFLKDKEVTYNKRRQTMDRELAIVKTCKEKAPIRDNKAMLDGINSRIKDYETKQSTMEYVIREINVILQALKDRLEIQMHPSLQECFKELYHNEKANTKMTVDVKYRYYPRLKKAKENALYVFCNKIKIIMEAQNVKFA